MSNALSERVVLLSCNSGRCLVDVDQLGRLQRYLWVWLDDEEEVVQ